MMINCSVCGIRARVNKSNKSMTCSVRCQQKKKREAAKDEELWSTCCGYPEHEKFTGLCSRCLEHADFEGEE